MLKISNHSGVEGYIIKNVRAQIDLALKVRRVETAFIAVIISIKHKLMTQIKSSRTLFIPKGELFGQQ